MTSIAILLCSIVLLLLSLDFFKTSASTDYGENFVTHKEFIDPDGYPLDDFVNGAEANVTFNWNIPDDVMIYAGDTMTFEMPRELRFSSSYSGKFFKYYYSSGENLGQYSFDVQTGLVTITFNDYYEIHPQNKNGIFAVVGEGLKSYLVLDLDSVLLTKIDKDDATTTLAGAVFNLYKESGTLVAQDLITNDLGEIQVDSLHPGSYYFIETRAPEGYELDATPVFFEIVTQQNAVVTVTKENQRELGAVGLIKKDIRNGQELPQAIFDLKNEAGETVQQGLVTDESGEIYLENLAPGSYYFVETKAPDGYYLDEEPLYFTITGNQIEPVWMTKFNTFILGNVQLIKIDAASGERLPHAIFQLTDANGDLLQDQLVTDEQGSIFISDLLPGKYQLIEIQAPKGYLLDSTPVTFEIEQGNDSRIEVIKENKSLFIPQPPTPEEPTPNISEKPIPIIDKPVSIPEKETKYEVLPQTGERSQNLFIQVGLLLILISIFFKKYQESCE